LGSTTPTTGTTSTPTTTTTTTTTPTGTTTGTGTTIAPVTAVIDLDGARDLVPFLYSNAAGVLLNPHLSAYDSTTVGAITGTLTISGLTGISSKSNASYVNIQVTAESVSTDGTRHVAVNSTAVKSSDGTFTLYPLPTTSASPTSYDLVIHGPAIATIIVKGVTVNPGDPATTTPVSIGTITPRAATPFSVNLETTTPLPAGAIVGFYQTLPASGEVPYLVEQAPIDPFNRNFPSGGEPLSQETIDYGTLSSGSVTLTAATPIEGASTYLVSATAPLFTDGALTTKVSPATASVPIAVPTLTVASGATANSASVTFTEASPGKYNAGQLIISHDGAVVATATLDTMLSQSNGGTVTLTDLPGGSGSTTFASGLYYVSVRTWNIGNLANVHRETYPTALDLRSGNVTGYQLRID
jgi:hypothetical protein